MQQLPMSTAYAVWTGIGAVGGAVLGMAFIKNQQILNGLFVFLLY